MDRPTFFSTGQVAARLGVHPQTLRRWERAGVVRPVTRRRGRRVYTAADVERIEAVVLERPAKAGEAARP